MRSTRTISIALALLLAACGGNIEVASRLDQDQAIRLAAALDALGIADVEVGTATGAQGGGSSVSVAAADGARARAVIAEQRLLGGAPTQSETSKSVFVEARELEHEHRVQLERTIESKLLAQSRIFSANLVLTMPEQRGPMSRQQSPTTIKASVLVRYWASADGGNAGPPLADERIQQLVSGCVDGLLPADVCVVQQSMAIAPRSKPVVLPPADQLWSSIIAAWPWLLTVAGVVLVATAAQRTNRQRQRAQERRHAQAA